MIYDAITQLLYVLVIVAFLQPNAPRLYAAVTFVSITFSHEVFLSSYDGLVYYGSAALFDLVIIAVLSGIRPVSKMVLSLQRICLASMLANFFGWCIWFAYLPPLAYDVTFVVIYVCTLIVFIRRSDTDVGGFTLDRWRSCFRFDRRTWRSCFNYYEGQV